MNSKGQYMESALMYLVLAFVLSFIIIFVLIIAGEVDNGIQGVNSSMMPDEAKEASSSMTAKLQGLDVAFAFLFFGFLIGSIVFVRLYTNFQLWMLIVAILGLIVIGFIGLIAENIWEAVNSNAVISGETANLTFLPFVMDNFVLLLIVFGVLVSIAAFTRGDIV